MKIVEKETLLKETSMKKELSLKVCQKNRTVELVSKYFFMSKKRIVAFIISRHIA